MDVGLDDIIKKDRKRRPLGRRPNRSASRNRGGRPGKRFSASAPPVGVKKAPLIDARAKIIARKRKTLRDAREKLNALHRQKDARLKLSTSSSLGLGSRLGAIGAAVLGDMVPRRTINNASRVPRPVMDSYSYERSDLSRRERVYRTIENDDDVEMWDPGALPQLEVRLTRPTPAPQYRPPVRELRTSREETWLKPSAPLVRMSEDSIKSRLEPLRQEEGFRIVVSNLQPTVTHEDIKELFEDIGPLLRSRVVRPGTAEVVYRDLKDAVTAVDTYHNRQLDGQPMKCLLVKPSTTGSKSMVGTKGSVVPDLSTIHKALFMK